MRHVVFNLIYLSVLSILAAWDIRLQKAGAK